VGPRVGLEASLQGVKLQYLCCLAHSQVTPQIMLPRLTGETTNAYKILDTIPRRGDHMIVLCRDGE
jgi:hypothetical protein